MQMTIGNYLNAHRVTIDRLAGLSKQIEQFAEIMVTAIRSGGKILVAGNGGSAADAQHLAAELVGRFLKERRGLPAIALTTDSSILTAVGNDYGFDRIFSRQVEALAVQGDVFLGISTSGNSSNILKAIEAAKEAGCVTLGLLGRDGGAIAPAADHSLIVPSDFTPHIQEGHLIVVHLLSHLVEEAFATEEGR